MATDNKLISQYCFDNPGNLFRMLEFFRLGLTIHFSPDKPQALRDAFSHILAAQFRGRLKLENANGTRLEGHVALWHQNKPAMRVPIHTHFEWVDNTTNSFNETYALKTLFEILYVASVADGENTLKKDALSLTYKNDRAPKGQHELNQVTDTIWAFFGRFFGLKNTIADDRFSPLEQGITPGVIHVDDTHKCSPKKIDELIRQTVLASEAQDAQSRVAANIITVTITMALLVIAYYFLHRADNTQKKKARRRWSHR